MAAFGHPSPESRFHGARRHGAGDARPGVKVYDGAPGETRVQLTFNQIFPRFSIVSNDNDHPTLGFGDTVRGNGAVVPPGAHGLLKAVEFNQRDGVLTIVTPHIVRGDESPAAEAETRR